MEELCYQVLDTNMVEDIVNIFVKTFNEAPWNEQWTKKTAYNRLYPLIEHGGFGLVCYYQKNICGFILGVEEQDYNGMAFTIREFCIDTSLQGKNIGTSLYQELEKCLKEKGIVSINLLTLKGQLPVKFYQKQGFEESTKITYMYKEL